ncbi:ABC transporter substrate-binding protein [Paenibacillus hamazuiensis]|uniref:ABC transporter substrate-binding protein n=1 Tax=Paenibacillus hamazuiensis TaxID=2936508 RepID=UPI00200EF4CA|nr:extracellular solute-binding protein [Paenibacillus hamazuiensis]
MLMKKSAGTVAALALLLMALQGCSGGASVPQTGPNGEAGRQEQAKPANEPVTLKFAVTKGWFGPGELDKYIIEPVKKKYPHITLEIIDTGAKDQSLDKVVAAGISPDLVMTANPLIHRLTTLDLQDDMEPLIRKFGFDLTKLNKAAVESVKSASGFDQLIGIPWTMHFHALYYNKDLFDRFGVPYPKDGMTWDETVELARKLTKTDGGVGYRGLEPDYSFRVASAKGLGMVDPKTEKALVNSDGWRRVYELLKTVYTIPGNGEYKLGAAAETQFMKDKTLAMLPGLNRLPLFKDAAGLNWDMVQYPQFPESPNTSMGVDEWILHVTRQSKYKDQAFQVIATVLSEEVQTDMARHARFPVLTGKSIEEQFGQAVPSLQGKNLKAAFLSQPAKAYPVSRYDEEAQKMMGGASIAPIVKGEKDINTVLRENEEKLNRYIEQNKAR